MPLTSRFLSLFLVLAMLVLVGCTESDESGDFGISENNDGAPTSEGTTDTGFDDVGDSNSSTTTENPDGGTTPGEPDGGTTPGEPDTGPTPTTDAGQPPDADPSVEPVDHGYYQSGPYSVMQQTIAEAPSDLLVYFPDGDGEYPLLVFQHGFVMYNYHYSQLLEHIASHGFVVAAPQMYDSGGLPFGAPSTTEEADAATALYDWIFAELNSRLGVDVDVTRLALAGHSRGTKVIYTSLRDSPRAVEAIIGIDPVDGTGGPGGGEQRILNDPPQLDAPLLLIGTGLGGESTGFFAPECAPEEDNYAQFFAAATAPAWQVVAPDYGHLDMLDDNPTGCGLSCDACVDGPSRAPFRTLTGGLTVALLEATLNGDEQALGVLSDDQGAPVDVEIDTK